MRISTSLMQMLGTQAMLDRQADVSRTQLQIATGKRILSPSDDPAGSNRILELNQMLSRLDQFQVNGETARTRLSQEDIALDSTVDVLQRLREMAVAANNDTVGAEGRAGMAVEVRGLLEQVLSLANTRDANDEYLFSGYQSGVQPFAEVATDTFAYAGDHGQRLIQIAAGRQVADRNNGFDVFMHLADAAGASRDLFSMVAQLAQNLEGNTPTGDDITNMDIAIDKIVSIRASVGGRLNSIETQVEINASSKLDAQTALSAIEDLDIASAISQFNLELLALQASQQAFAKVQNLSLFNFL